MVKPNAVLVRATHPVPSGATVRSESWTHPVPTIKNTAAALITLRPKPRLVLGPYVGFHASSAECPKGRTRCAYLLTANRSVRIAVVYAIVSVGVGHDHPDMSCAFVRRQHARASNRLGRARAQEQQRGQSGSHAPVVTGFVRLFKPPLQGLRLFSY